MTAEDNDFEKIPEASTGIELVEHDNPTAVDEEKDQDRISPGKAANLPDTQLTAESNAETRHSLSATASVDLVDQLAKSFKEDFQKSAMSIIKAGDACARCDELLRDQDERRLEAIDRFGVSESTFSKFTTIGGSLRLHEPSVIEMCPANWTIIYEIAALDEVQFKRAVSAGVIRRDMQRADLAPYRPLRGGHRKRKQLFATIRCTEVDPSREALRQDLYQLQKKYSSAEFHFTDERKRPGAATA